MSTADFSHVVNKRFREMAKKEGAKTDALLDQFRSRLQETEQLAYTLRRERLEYEHIAIGLWHLLQPMVRAEIEAVLAEVHASSTFDNVNVEEIKEAILAKIKAEK